MKAALDAWGSKTNHFHQGFAKQSDDPEIIAATMAKPGVVLRRAVGSTPKNLASGKVKPAGERAQSPRQPPRKIDEKTARKAAIAYAKDQKRRAPTVERTGDRGARGVMSLRAHYASSSRLVSISAMRRAMASVKPHAARSTPPRHGAATDPAHSYPADTLQ
jgi:colicin import membrane protein